MRVGDPRRHLDIEGSQDPLVPAGILAYSYVLIGADVFGRPIDTKPLLQEYLDSLFPGNVLGTWEHPGRPGQPTGYHEGEVIAPELGHLGVVHVKNTVSTVRDGQGRVETSVPDIPWFAGPTRALVHDRLEGFPQLVVSPRSVEPLPEQPQGTVSTHMTAGLMGPLQQRSDSVTGYHDAVLVPEVALVPLPLILVDQEGFKAFLQALVDIPKLLQYSDCWSPSRGRIVVMLRSKWTSIRLNAS